MDAAKVKALRRELKNVEIALENAECQAADARTHIISLSRRLDSLEKAIGPARFTPGEGAPGKVVPTQAGT